MNGNLEEMAQALYIRWFVDFEFPDERGEPYKSGGGAFAESELGPIPAGWNVVPLGTKADIASGKRPKSRREQPDGEHAVPLIGAGGTMGYVKEALYDAPILVTGRVGTLGIVQRHGRPCWPSDNTLVIQCDHYEFMYQLLKRIDFRSFNRGSTQPLVSQSDVRNLKVAWPDDELIKRFEQIVASFYELVQKNKDENGRLEAIRNALLPKLMSGEIRVPVNRK
jgi:type I restriction enzyme S subunit